jgi:3-methyl-2-oxobutanoate hydroxymethyltransferase
MTVRAGIPVIGHLGLTPQSIHQFGGFTPRGVTSDEAKQMLKDAAALEESGAFAIVLEKIPAALAAKITKKIKIPTIGIGAGMHCDGQVLVVSDMLGLNEDFHPRFVRRYAILAETIRQSVSAYVKDVKEEKFPVQKKVTDAISSSETSIVTSRGGGISCFPSLKKYESNANSIFPSQ